MATCKNCGSEIRSTSVFCPKCGSAVEETNSYQMDSSVNSTYSNPYGYDYGSEYAKIDTGEQMNEFSGENEKGKKKKLKLIIIISVVVVAILIAAVCAFVIFSGDSPSDNKENSNKETVNQPSNEVSDIKMADFKADEYYFLTEKDNDILFTISVKGTFEKVELYCGDKSTAVMNDNGENGDIKKDDGIYSCTIKRNVNSDKMVIEKYYAKASDAKSDELNLYFISHADIKNSSDSIREVDHDIRELENAFNKNGNDEEKKQSAINVYNSVTAYFDNLVKEGIVLEYTKEDNVITAVFHGITYIYEFDLRDDIQNGLGYEDVRTNENDISTDLIDKDVISIQPYASELVSSAFDDSAELVDALYGYSFESNIDDGEVNIDFMRNLDDYDVIIWDGHGAYNSSSHSMLATGESVSNADLYPEELIGSNPGIVANYGSRLCVTPYFFINNYEEGDFENTVLFIAGCFTAKDRVLADAFLNYGASAFYGYDSSVYTGYNRRMTEALFDALTDFESDELGTKTVTDSLAEAKNEVGDKDDTRDGDWWYQVMVFFGWEDKPAELVLYCNENCEDYRLLTPVGTLAGKVCDAMERETVIPNAKIEIYSDGKLLKTLASDENGNYAVDLPVGDYELKISAEGYLDFGCYASVEKYICTYTETFLMIAGDENEVGNVSGIVSNALTGMPVGDIEISIYEGWNNYGRTEIVGSTTTSQSGTYSVDLKLGNYTVKGSKEGFVDVYFNIIVTNGFTENQNGAISPEVSGDDYFITLTWDERPNDLDSHVKGKLSDGSDFHVYYVYSEHQDYEPNYVILDPPTDNGEIVCRLDCDDINSFGPEHVTIHTTTDEPYYYYIHNFSGESALTYSGANVTIQQGNNVIADFNVPTDFGDGEYWNVFAIKDGSIIISNTITYEPDVTYAD